MLVLGGFGSILALAVWASGGPDATDLERQVAERVAGGESRSPETLALADRALAAEETESILALLTRIHLDRGSLAPALAYASRRVELLGPEDDERLAAALSDEGEALAGLSRFDDALDRHRRAREIRTRLFGSESAPAATSAVHVGTILSRTGRYADSRGLLENALGVLERTLGADAPEVAWALEELSQPLSRSGEFGEARGLLERALSIRSAARPPDRIALARCRHRLATLQKNTGEYAAARAGFLESKAILEEELGPDHPDLVKSWNMLGVVARRTGDFENGATYYRRALDLAVASYGAEHKLVGIVTMNLANLQVEAGEPAAALPLFERALEIQRSILGPDNPELAHAHNNLSRCLLEMGEYERAIPHAERALALWEESFGREHYHLASAVDNLAGIHMLHRGNERAEALYRRALEMRGNVLGPDHPEVAESYIHLARFRWLALGDDTGATELALEGEAMARNQFRRIAGGLTEAEALRFESIRTKGFNVALSVLASGAGAGEVRVRQAWEQLVGSRALVLDETARRQWIARRLATDEFAPLVEALDLARRRLAELVLRGPDGDEQESYQSRLEEARQVRDAAERALADRSRDYGRSIQSAEVGAEEVRAALAPEAAIVSYVRYGTLRWLYDEPDPDAAGYVMRFDPSYLAFVVRADGTAPAVVPLGPAGEIDRLVELWRDEAGRRPASLKVARDREEAAYRTRADELRRRIWDPVVTALGSATTVFVVPDGSLHLVSLPALTVPDGSYLIEGGPRIHHLSAERDLAGHARQAPEGRGFLAFGGADFSGTPRPAPKEPSTRSGTPEGCESLAELSFEPLPASTREVDELARLWTERWPAPDSEGGEARVLTGTAASEAAFKRLAPGSRVVHLATHGFFVGDDCPDGENPAGVGGNPLLLSGLALAGANRRGTTATGGTVGGAEREDGILTAEEIASLDLAGVEWVVLSACETGVGRLHAGEGVLGLRRAFETAGAGTLILSLWQVDDQATREWMRRLYEERLAGRSTADAVRRAGLLILQARRESGASTHPFHWGAFVAAGDWR